MRSESPTSCSPSTRSPPTASSTREGLLGLWQTSGRLSSPRSRLHRGSAGGPTSTEDHRGARTRDLVCPSGRRPDPNAQHLRHDGSHPVRLRLGELTSEPVPPFRNHQCHPAMPSIRAIVTQNIHDHSKMAIFEVHSHDPGNAAAGRSRTDTMVRRFMMSFVACDVRVMKMSNEPTIISAPCPLHRLPVADGPPAAGIRRRHLHLPPSDLGWLSSPSTSR